jgi:hypothetical protein
VVDKLALEVANRVAGWRDDKSAYSAENHPTLYNDFPDSHHLVKFYDVAVSAAAIS